MTNYEKFKDKIVALDYDIAMDKNGKLAPCHNCGIRCDDCAFDDCEGLEHSCRQATVRWLFSEYEEPPVDWSKVPVDTPILVKDAEHKKWIPRHFAKYEDGKVYAWTYGLTSYTAHDFDDTLISWPIAKLYKEEES